MISIVVGRFSADLFASSSAKSLYGMSQCPRHDIISVVIPFPLITLKFVHIFLSPVNREQMSD